MALRKFNVGCPCCECAIGFDFGIWEGQIGCYDEDVEIVDSVATLNRNRLNDLDNFFVGINSSCFVPFAIPPDMNEEIGEWVTNGGRLYVAGEFEGCAPEETKTAINTLLSDIGTTMSLGSRACNCFCLDWAGISQNVAILTTPTPIDVFHACTTEVVGGTPISLTTVEGPVLCLDSFPFIAAERIGSGWVIVAGDANIYNTCPGINNCEFFRRWVCGGPVL